jgi:hypothetical protein
MACRFSFCVTSVAPVIQKFRFALEAAMTAPT